METKIQDRNEDSRPGTKDSRPGTNRERRFKTRNDGNEDSRPERRFKTRNERFKTRNDGTKIQDQERWKRRFNEDSRPESWRFKTGIQDRETRMFESNSRVESRLTHNSTTRDSTHNYRVEYWLTQTRLDSTRLVTRLELTHSELYLEHTPVTYVAMKCLVVDVKVLVGSTKLRTLVLSSWEFFGGWSFCGGYTNGFGNFANRWEPIILPVNCTIDEGRSNDDLVMWVRYQ